MKGSEENSRERLIVRGTVLNHVYAMRPVHESAVLSGPPWTGETPTTDVINGRTHPAQFDLKVDSDQHQTLEMTGEPHEGIKAWHRGEDVPVPRNQTLHCSQSKKNRRLVEAGTPHSP